ncbi:PLP-dependent aminotransferase family protein [Fonticella tunisiensis]|uniref:DNA-binding transcriptional MocR family regulator n=1 Tax=Fonticella tunisiensis TaxID=1096341 RepID=A0A4R7K8D9_9CLOT|nr:PLP-dependent aminotransferase family protein [Fonticella tunisiensis]TDT47635.1 DNA-binding transcriptional MocR family regulator [Fonticella tunisiensis]
MKYYESIVLNRDSKEPMYIQLYEGIKSLIENGSIKGDEKLPTIRKFAEKLGVNNVTVVNAYKLLEQKGYVYSKVGSGTYARGAKESHVYGSIDTASINIHHGYIKLGKNEINFSTSTPNPELFPVTDFKEVLNEVLDRDGGFAFGYQESQGYYPLRESIRDYLEEKDVSVNTENIHVISGAQQGIDIVAKALIGFNDTVIVESPTYTGAIAAFKSRGANIIEVPIRRDGIDTKELEEVLKTTDVKLIYVMTSFQNPTGVSYSQDKKLQLLYLAQKYNVYILEDDYLSELRFYGEGSMPIKSLDAKNKIIYLKSFSKIFMPGIRLGFLVAPDVISRRILSAKHNTDISTSSLMQRAFDLYLRKRKWQEHLNLMLRIYKERYDVLIYELKRKMPYVYFEEPEGGIHIWGKTDLESSILSSIGQQKGVLIAPGRVFYIDDKESSYFRISFAGVEKDKISEGVELLNAAYQDYRSANTANIMPFL